MYYIPKTGYTILHPTTGKALPPEGAEVGDPDFYWVRLENDGDVTRGGAPAPMGVSGSMGGVTLPPSVGGAAEPDTSFVPPPPVPEPEPQPEPQPEEPAAEPAPEPTDAAEAAPTSDDAEAHVDAHDATEAEENHK